MKNSYKVIKSIMRTEKGTEQAMLNKYLFWVDKLANKVDIKRAVEDIYSVKVTGVNTVFMRGKSKRVRYQLGKTSDWKKAIVTLKQGDKIEVT